ncbi:MAG: magnesium transporter [Synergistetes bacterium]|nr:magnesium transporter [Synergistota bacterium]
MEAFERSEDSGIEKRELELMEGIEAIENRDWKRAKDILSSWSAPDIAELFREIDPKDRPLALRLLPPDLQADVFFELDGSVQEYILKALPDEHVRSIVNELDPDERTRIFERLSPRLLRRLLNLLSAEERREALQLLGYPENSVGRLMTPDYVAIKRGWTVSKALEHIREWGKDSETIDIVYVVDDGWRLLDDIPIRKLLLADPNQVVESIMDFEVVSITADQDQEEAIKLARRYNLIALPVTDSEGHLLGIVTVDDLLDVIQEEHTEDFVKYSAIEAPPESIELLTNIKEAPIKKILRSRLTWLIILLVMDFVTGSIISSFEETIAKYIVLVTFLPVLVDTAGNAGSQAATLVIRALALETVRLKDWLYLFGRELVIASILGILMGLGISVMGIIRSGSLKVCLVVVTSMIINVIAGSLVGVLLPFIFVKFKKDPASASTPLITTLADIIGTGVYLGVASIILGV